MLILTAVTAYISTNLDDLFLLIFCYARAVRKREKFAIACGRYLALCVIFAASLAVASGLKILPQKYLGLLGIVPILLGIRARLLSRRDTGNHQPESIGIGAGILTTAILSISNSADNIGVYVPLFVGYGIGELVVWGVVFGVMTALWCFLGDLFAAFPWVRRGLERWRHIVVPAVLILLGVYVLAKHYC